MDLCHCKRGSLSLKAWIFNSLLIVGWLFWGVHTDDTVLFVYTSHECGIVGIYLNKNLRKVPSLEHKLLKLPDTTTLMLRGGPGTERKNSMLYTITVTK